MPGNVSCCPKPGATINRPWLDDGRKDPAHIRLFPHRVEFTDFGVTARVADFEGFRVRIQGIQRHRRAKFTLKTLPLVGAFVHPLRLVLASLFEVRVEQARAPFLQFRWVSSLS